MSSTKERLVKAWKNSLLAGMATIAKSPTQLDEAIKDLNKNLKKLGIELTDEERKEAREIACQKRDKRKEFLASFGKALKKVRIKESKMTKNSGLTEEDRKALERVKALPRKIRKKALQIIKEEPLEKCDGGYCAISPQKKRRWKILCWIFSLVAAGIVISVGVILPLDYFVVALLALGFGTWIWIHMVSSMIITPCPSSGITEKYCKYYTRSNKK